MGHRFGKIAADRLLWTQKEHHPAQRNTHCNASAASDQSGWLLPGAHYGTQLAAAAIAVAPG
jgi:hypothetical protein